MGFKHLELAQRAAAPGRTEYMWCCALAEDKLGYLLLQGADSNLRNRITQEIRDDNDDITIIDLFTPYCYMYVG